MALVSPGVEVTIVDESNYLPAGTNSVPYILLATAQNKISGTGPNVAPGTLAENAGKVYLITSQRDLGATFGNPFFYKTSNGTPINGYELNEYGLLAAHSVLGISNRAYIQRADIDLAALTATLVRPTGAPDNGTYWLDTTVTSWGINQWNETTGNFTVITPLVITDTAQLDGGIPADSVGSIGGYAVVATNSSNPLYYKNTNNEWVLVGSDDWKLSWPTVQGTESVFGSALTTGNVIVINGSAVAVPGTTTLAALVSAINAAAIAGVTASADSSNRLVLLADSDAESDGSSASGGVVNIDPASTPGLLTTLGIVSGLYFTPALQQSPNFTVPRWRPTDTQPRPTGSVWNKTTAPNLGTAISIKEYSTDIASFISKPAPLYNTDRAANAALDPVGGGQNIPAGTLYTQFDVSPEAVSNGLNNTFTMKLFERSTTGATIIFGSTTNPTFTIGNTFTISTSQAGTAVPTPSVTVTITGTTAADFVAAVSAAAVPNVIASVSSTGSIVFTETIGGTITLTNVTGTPITTAGFTTATPGVRLGTNGVSLILSNWVPLVYTASPVAPDQDPDAGQYWYYSATNQVDIMINTGNQWVGYQTLSNDVRGYNLALTNPTGPIISAAEPTVQTDGTPLVYGDLWVDVSNLELYPVLYRWQSISNVDQWVAIDNADQTTSNGILFADARWATNGTTNPITDAIPTITSLLTSNYLDIDAPDPEVYAAGTLLWNTRRSGFNVKTFQPGYFNAITFEVDPYDNGVVYATGEKVLYNGVIYVALQAGSSNIPTNAAYWAVLQTNSWVTASGNRADGSPYMGRLAVRAIVVQAMKSAIDSQETLREEQNVFNLLACPQYPELIPNMTALNNERSNTGFVIGDTPLRLAVDANSLVEWATNNNGLGVFAGDSVPLGDPYVGVFYPSCQTTDLGGSPVVQPPSHMMLRTIVRSDAIAYPWLAPAGTRRGLVDNAAVLGYVNSQTGEFVTTATGQGVRDVLYENRVNPITFIPGSGIVNYGNKTVAATPSALDRINVSRLIAFIRARLNEIADSFVFEPNDQITRNEITNAITGLMTDLVAKRGIYDYLVVCDLSNNTPARIDRNELYVDIAIEPVKAVEFIYIPVRIKNTGEISGGNVASSAAV
jgi:hypothetical protein